MSNWRLHLALLLLALPIAAQQAPQQQARVAVVVSAGCQLQTLANTRQVQTSLNGITVSGELQFLLLARVSKAGGTGLLQLRLTNASPDGKLAAQAQLSQAQTPAIQNVAATQLQTVITLPSNYRTPRPGVSGSVQWTYQVDDPTATAPVPDLTAICN